MKLLSVFSLFQKQYDKHSVSISLRAQEGIERGIKSHFAES
jgi:hypothetical protein